jgi:cell wall-associated NlpC family hydrolase
MRNFIVFCLLKPRHQSGLLWSERAKRIRPIVLLLFVTLLLDNFSGCAPVAPRFRSGKPSAAPSSTPVKPAPARKDSVRSGDTKDATENGRRETIPSSGRSFRTEKNDAISNLDQARMMREISKMMGVSYKLGGESEDGIDCSAYTLLVYKNSVGFKLPRSSVEQYKMGTAVSYEDLKFGDLVFFNTTGEEASHVGIYLGDDLFAHASVTLGVTISSLESMYYKERYDGSRRIIR